MQQLNRYVPNELYPVEGGWVYFLDPAELRPRARQLDNVSRYRHELRFLSSSGEDVLLQKYIPFPEYTEGFSYDDLRMNARVKSRDNVVWLAISQLEEESILCSFREKMSYMNCNEVFHNLPRCEHQTFLCVADSAVILARRDHIVFLTPETLTVRKVLEVERRTTRPERIVAMHLSKDENVLMTRVITGYGGKPVIQLWDI